MKHLIDGCKMFETPEDTRPYSRGWLPVGFDLTSDIEYHYTPADELGGLPITGRLNTYGAGGYIVPLFEHSTIARPQYVHKSQVYK